MKFVVWKELKLTVEVEADDEDHAIQIMLDMDDATFDVADSTYTAISLESDE